MRLFGETADVADDGDDELAKTTAMIRYFDVPALISPIKEMDVVDESRLHECFGATSPIEAAESAADTQIPLPEDAPDDATDDIADTEQSDAATEMINDAAMDVQVEPSDIVSGECETQPPPASPLPQNGPADSVDVVAAVDSEHAEQHGGELADSVIINADFDDSFSPASPQPELNACAQYEPPEIPLVPRMPFRSVDAGARAEEPDTSAAIIDHFIYNYSAAANRQIAAAARDPYANEAYLLASLRNALEMHHLKATPAHDCVERLLHLTRRPLWLATAILEMVEDTREKISMACTPPAPAMQPTLQKLLVVTVHLSRAIAKFDRFVQFELERRLFSLTKEKDISEMVNLTHFYTGLIGIEPKQDLAKVRLFIYKCLYYFTYKSVPLVFTVIMAHPLALPHANVMDHISDPVTRAIVSILTNIPYSAHSAQKDAALYRKNEMYMTLRLRFGHFIDKSFPIDGAIDHCVEQLSANRLANVSYALILLAKRQGLEFAMKEIVEKRLRPLLDHYFTQNLSTTTAYDQQIVVILQTIGSIVKTMPVDANVDAFADLYQRCLKATERQAIQEAAVAAICQLNRFGASRIYEHLKAWTPNYAISDRTEAMLRTLVHRKRKPYWFQSAINST